MLGAVVSWRFAYRSIQAARKANAIAMRSEYLSLRNRFRDFMPQLGARGITSPLSHSELAEMDGIVHDAKHVSSKLHAPLKRLADAAWELSTTLKATPEEVAQANEHWSECKNAAEEIGRAFEELLTLATPDESG